jgi:quinol-cytochrome oxidoreductase complex cytochrome b subunit
LNWTNWIRQVHRWLAAAFTVGFVVNSVVIFVLGQKQPASWVYLLALIPLFLLLPTGLYLFALPYAAKWGAPRRAGGVGAVSE